MAQQKLPKLRALGGEERAGDEQPGREGHRKPEIADVKQSAENETWHEDERILEGRQRERNDRGAFANLNGAYPCAVARKRKSNTMQRRVAHISEGDMCRRVYCS